MAEINKIPHHFVVWAKKMNEERIKKGDRFFIHSANMDLAYCVDLRTGKSGLARRRSNDAFNPDVGKAIAYARCRGYEIPKWVNYKAMKEMANGEKFKLSNGKVYTFIGILCKTNPSDIKTYVISENENDVTRFMSSPYEEYEMVE